jgi:hypothetical protein
MSKPVYRMSFYFDDEDLNNLKKIMEYYGTNKKAEAIRKILKDFKNS